MKKSQIVRAWRDPNYRHRLGAEQEATMSAHPAGATLVEDADLNGITGGCSPGCGNTSTGWCTGCRSGQCF